MVYIIAEAGVNNNGRLDETLALIDVAKAVGADAVKFQMFTADKLVSKKADPQQWGMLKGLETPKHVFKAAARRCTEVNIDFLCTPFDEESLDFLVGECGMTRVKISSPDLVNMLLVTRAIQTKLPVILSTGGASYQEIRDVVKLENKTQITLLHCVSQYPARATKYNLKAMVGMKALGFPVGLSDHSLGDILPIMATALGATVIEKHFTRDKKAEGPDHAMSLDPDEFGEMVTGIRIAEKAMGDGKKRPMDGEVINKVRRGAYAVIPIPKGTEILRSMVAMKRPATGLPVWDVIGSIAEKDYAVDDPI